MLFVYHKGKLSDFFDIDAIENLYKKHGTNNLNWELIRMLANKPLEYFGSKESSLNIRSCGGKEELVITGLLLGYPIESTIASLNNTATVHLPDWAKRR